MGAVILAAAVLLLFERLRPLLIRALDQRDRVITLTMLTPPLEEIVPAPVIPDHLEWQVQQYTSPWAQEEARQAMYESYAELGDWDLVTNAFSRTAAKVSE